MHSDVSIWRFATKTIAQLLPSAAESAVLANDLKHDGFTVISLDTGWVRTEMGNTTEQLGHGCAPLDVLTSVAGTVL